MEPNNGSDYEVLDYKPDPAQQQAPSLMSTVNSKLKEEVTTTRGIQWLTVIGVPVVTLCISVVVMLITATLSYQANVSRVEELNKRVLKLEDFTEKFQDFKGEFIKTSSAVEVIKAKQADAEADRRQMARDVSDIKILLGQKTLREAQ